MPTHRPASADRDQYAIEIVPITARGGLTCASVPPVCNADVLGLTLPT
jgi:hypothetical protein